MILTTTPDVLLVIVVMFAVGTAASQLLFRKSPLARAVARVGLLILLTLALLYAGVVPYQAAAIYWSRVARRRPGCPADRVVAVDGVVPGRLSARLRDRRAPTA